MEVEPVALGSTIGSVMSVFGSASTLVSGSEFAPGAGTLLVSSSGFVLISVINSSFGTYQIDIFCISQGC